MGTAPEMWEKVIGESTRTDTKEGSDEVASSGRYGLMAGEHLNARRGEEDVAGMGKRPPASVNSAERH